MGQINPLIYIIAVPPGTFMMSLNSKKALTTLEHINGKCNLLLFYLTLFRMQVFPCIVALSFKFCFCCALKNIIFCLTLKIQTQMQHFEFVAG